ncbi:MAG: omptin family outer membrane protease [Gammaproteobacteria bacterium]
MSAPYKASNGDSTFYLSAGQASVKANEIVYGQPAFGYPPDYKLSQLIWEVKNNPVLIGGLSYERNKTRINLELQTSVTEGDGVMDDYDWRYIGLDWSDWSHHEDTSLTDYHSLDINFDYHFHGSDDSAWRFLFGYRESNWKWESRGGTFIYSTVPIDFRDQSGTFTPGELVISYEQEFSMPYVGIKYEGKNGKWKYHFQYEYSNWVSMKATDYHFLPDIIFVDDFADGDMSAYKIGVAYKFYSQLEGFIRYDAREYEELRGNTLYRDSNTGAIIGYCENCAGADNSSSAWSIGISYIY